MGAYPADRKYTKDHEWARIEDGTATVGITRYAQEALGEVVYVELPGLGAVLKAGESFGVVESTKAVSELYAPLSGKVLAVNDALFGSPELINQGPHERAWMVKVKLSDLAEVDKLMDAEGYEQHLAAASH